MLCHVTISNLNSTTGNPNLFEQANYRHTHVIGTLTKELPFGMIKYKCLLIYERQTNKAPSCPSCLSSQFIFFFSGQMGIIPKKAVVVAPYCFIFKDCLRTRYRGTETFLDIKIILMVGA